MVSISSNDLLLVSNGFSDQIISPCQLVIWWVWLGFRTFGTVARPLGTSGIFGAKPRKGKVGQILKDAGIPYAIIRHTLVFGEGDLLLNNMA